jgi:glycosyltransferase EpsH
VELGTLVLDNKFEKALENRIALSVLGLGLNVCCSNDNPPVGLLRSELKKILSNPKILSALSNFDLSPLPIHWKVFYYCAKHQFVVPLFVLLKIVNTLRRFY